jgi:hypothetical protein
MVGDGDVAVDVQLEGGRAKRGDDSVMSGRSASR